MTFLLTTGITLYLIFAAYPTAAADSESIDPRIDKLYEHLTKTKAIGVFTKLSIKSNITRLHKSFTVYHQGERPPNLEELRERYDLMVQEMVILVQDKDLELAREIHATRLLLGYRAVVAIADGIDHGSEHTFSEIVREFHRAAVPLYVIGFDCGIAARGLGSLGDQGGGLFLSAPNPWELSSVCQSLLRRLENHYSISYELKEKPRDAIRLWIEGSAGSGKTFVEAVVIET